MKFKFDRITAIFLLILGTLYLLSSFFKDYRDNNSYQLSTEFYLIFSVVVLSITMLFVIYHSLEKDKFIKIAKGFAYGVFFSLFAVFCLLMIKEQAIFFLNRVYVKQTIEEEFEIRYRIAENDDNKVGLNLASKKLYFRTENKFSDEDLLKIQKKDTITIQYHIGLLDKPFLPYGKIDIID